MDPLQPGAAVVAFTERRDETRRPEPVSMTASPIDRRRLPLNSLRAFEAAARQMSFTRAAESLGVTQSAVSRHVLNLEEVIGAQLFERRGSSLALTAAGQDLIGNVTPALDRLQAGLNAICEIDRGGTLRLALPPSFAIRMAAPIIETCRAQGGVAIEIDTPYVLESLDSTVHDAAVVFSRPRVTDQVMDLLWMEELTFCAGRTWRRACGRRGSPQRWPAKPSFTSAMRRAATPPGWSCCAPPALPPPCLRA